MKIDIDQEFKEICKQIIDEHKAEHEWTLIESSDMFQTEHYCGGYDATENAFCFSYYNEKGDEFWFQVTLDQIKRIMESKIPYLESSN
ncbi:MAG: hypothetical protein K2X02_08890 [Alphaproteobacteria bacterium]|nr:hypothetical protein [Alphaproteobacteria bacterium]